MLACSMPNWIVCASRLADLCGLRLLIGAGVDLEQTCTVAAATATACVAACAVLFKAMRRMQLLLVITKRKDSGITNTREIELCIPTCMNTYGGQTRTHSLKQKKTRTTCSLLSFAFSRTGGPGFL